MIAVDNLWHKLWTGNEKNCFLSDAVIEKAFHCDNTSWAKIIDIVKKLDIEYIVHSPEAIELIAPDAEKFSLRIHRCHYEDEGFDYSQLDGMDISEAIEELKTYSENVKTSTPFEYILLRFNTPSVFSGLDNKILAIPPTDPKFLEFMSDAKEKLHQTSEILKTAIDSVPEPLHTKAIKELENIAHYESLCTKIRMRISEKGYDKEFSLSYIGLSDVKLSIKINDRYCCSRTIIDSSFLHDVDELLECSNSISNIFSKHGDIAMCAIPEYGSGNWKWERLTIDSKLNLQKRSCSAK